MTDFEKMTALFQELNVNFSTIHREQELIEKDKSQIQIGCGVGYAGFLTEFYFDKDSKYLTHGVWE